MRAYARMANDTQMEMDAAELRLRAERRLGIMLTEAKRSGQVAEGRPKNCAPEEQFSRVRLDDAGIDRKLSARSQKVGGIGEQAFEAMVDGIRDRIAAGARISMDISAQDKKIKRAERERALAQNQSALPDKKYGVIYADPEWRFEVYSRDTGMDRSADNHYRGYGSCRLRWREKKPPLDWRQRRLLLSLDPVWSSII
jgi:hypothetical protein